MLRMFLLFVLLGMLYILSLFGIGIESFLLCLFVVVRIQLQKVLSQGYKDCTWTLYVKTGR